MIANFLPLGNEIQRIIHFIQKMFDTRSSFSNQISPGVNRSSVAICKRQTRTSRAEHSADTVSTGSSPSPKKKAPSGLHILDKSTGHSLNLNPFEQENDRSFSDAEEAITATENFSKIPGLYLVDRIQSTFYR